jgi:hypothetical protein
MPTCNERFAVIAAKARRNQCKFGSLYPAESLVEVATTPSRRDISGKWWKAQRENDRTKI